MAELIIWAKLSTKKGFCRTGLSLNKAGRPANRAATISAIGLILKPAILMSKTTNSKAEVRAKDLGFLNASRLGYHSMSELLEHLGQHHSISASSSTRNTDKFCIVSPARGSGIQKLGNRGHKLRGRERLFEQDTVG
jgi:hypothetical protein